MRKISFMLNEKSRVKGDFHARFCERLGLKCPCLLGVCHEKQERERLFRNCMNDDSRSIVHALQQECTNRPKVLFSKGTVLNVWVKRGRKDFR